MRKHRHYACNSKAPVTMAYEASDALSYFCAVRAPICSASGAGLPCAGAVVGQHGRGAQVCPVRAKRHQPRQPAALPRRSDLGTTPPPPFSRTYACNGASPTFSERRVMFLGRPLSLSLSPSLASEERLAPLSAPLSRFGISWRDRLRLVIADDGGEFSEGQPCGCALH